MLMGFLVDKHIFWGALGISFLAAKTLTTLDLRLRLKSLIKLGINKSFGYYSKKWLILKDIKKDLNDIIEDNKK
jgi:hypothetical protein